MDAVAEEATINLFTWLCGIRLVVFETLSGPDLTPGATLLIMTNQIHYNYKKTLSYQANLNLIVSERGFGKTYGFLEAFTNNFIKHKEEFIYLRRFQSEIDKVSGKLFAKHLDNQAFPEDFGITYKNGIYYGNSQPFCYMIPLTKEGHIKSVPMPKVKYILYDEFLITNRSQHYIPNEPFQLLSFIDSIYRDRDPHVYLCGNASSRTNPYFEYFNIHLPHNSEYALFKNNTILVHYSQNKAYQESRKQTKFGKMISGTSYGNYSIDNSFMNDNFSFIAKKPSKAWLFACLYINQHNYGLWIESGSGNMYISQAYDPKNPRCFAITPTDHTETARLATVRNSPWFKKMIECYRYNQLYFENINVKNYVLKAIKSYL